MNTTTNAAKSVSAQFSYRVGLSRVTVLDFRLVEPPNSDRSCAENLRVNYRTGVGSLSGDRAGEGLAILEGDAPEKDVNP